MLSPIYPCSLLLTRMSCQVVTSRPLAKVSLTCPRCPCPCSQHHAYTAQHWHHCAFPFASWTTEPHTLQHTLPCHHPFQHMCHHTLSGSANTHTKTRADKCYSTGVTTMKYLLLVLALQFTGLSFSIPRFTKLILTDLMSHPQSRFFVHLYLGMHGLIFNTSI